MRFFPAVAVTVALVLAPSAPSSAQTTLDGDQRILHVLDRLAYGPRPGDVERVRRIGLDTYLAEQLDPERVDDAVSDVALRPLRTLGMGTAELLREYPRPDKDGKESLDRRPAQLALEMQAAKLLRAVLSERQLQEVMVDFWFNHFNVDVRKGDVRWYLTSYERDVIRPHALGNFTDLVRATARHPAMLYYLDNWVSVRPDFVRLAGPERGTRAGLNENYARELMELHTLGVDGGYTQKDVTEVARCFTGWSIEAPQQVGAFAFRPRTHDGGEKVVLGHRIPPGGGESDGHVVIGILVSHPSTARFIATKLVRRFVSDDPDPALVARVAAAYRATGGDVRAMLRAIVQSPEFLSPAVYRAKIKKPSELVVSAVRALGARVDADTVLALARASARIGEPLYQAQPPTGHPDRADAWVNTGALLARMNFALDLTQGRLGGVRVDLSPLTAGVDVRDPAAVLDRVLADVLQGRATASTRETLRRQLGEPQIRRATPDDRTANPDVEKIVALVLGSPEFQRR